MFPCVCVCNKLNCTPWDFLMLKFFLGFIWAKRSRAIMMCVEFWGHFNELKTEMSFIILDNNTNTNNCNISIISSPIKTTYGYGAGAGAGAAFCNNNICLLLRKFSYATFKVTAVKLI